MPACIGKWHLGMNWVDGKPGTEKEVPQRARMSDGPNALGFDYFYGFTHARNIGTIIEQDHVVANVKSVENQPLMIKKALDWLGHRKAGEPFFLYFPMGTPHEPVVPSAEYTGKSGAQDLVRKDPGYGDWLFQGDAMLGQIMTALDDGKLADNTLLIATSDNGAEHRAYEPLRESKRSIYEGGHRVPYVARWPGKVKAGTTWNHPICLNDLTATAVEIIGATIPANAAEDSVSMLPALLGSSDAPTREATVHQSSSGDLAIRQGPWKLIFHTDGKRELFNLADDLSETKNVIEANGETVTKLTALMHRYIDRGRSTAGDAQKNDFGLSIAAKAGGKGKKAKKKSEVDDQ